MTNYCGTVAMLGRPNAGKSTLLNSFVGQKVAGVSKKPQTTRNRILGVVTEGPHQMLFLDTPGVHSTRGMGRLNQMIVREAMAGLEEADILLYLVDAKKGLGDFDRELLSRLMKQFTGPLYCVVSKCDAVGKNQVAAVRESIEGYLAAQGWTVPVLTLSAKRRESLVATKELLKQHLPAGEFLYPEDDLTNRSTKFIVGELIRESIFRAMGQELPYETAVVVTSFAEGQPVVIHADIVVARRSQKGIMIGKQGATLKAIGQNARQSIEGFLDQKVYLDLHVRVEERWIDQNQAICDLVELHPG